MEIKQPYFIYKTTNLLNNKIYIGQHTGGNVKYFGSGRYILRALKKYGKQNFVREIICNCETILELNNKEEYYIKLYNATNTKIGYNILFGGTNVKGLPKPKATELAKNRISKSLKRYFSNQENRDKIRGNLLAYNKTNGGKLNAKLQSERVKKRFLNKEEKQASCNIMKKHFSKIENRKKHSEIINKYYQTEIGKQKPKESMALFFKTEKGKEILKNSTTRLKNHWKNPENVAKIKAKKELFWGNNENKKIHSLSIKKGMVGKPHPKAITIIQLSLDGFLIGVHNSISDASVSSGISTKSISGAINGKTKTQYKYIWKN